VSSHKTSSSSIAPKRSPNVRRTGSAKLKRTGAGPNNAHRPKQPERSTRLRCLRSKPLLHRARPPVTSKPRKAALCEKQRSGAMIRVRAGRAKSIRNVVANNLLNRRSRTDVRLRYQTVRLRLIFGSSPPLRRTTHWTLRARSRQSLVATLAGKSARGNHNAKSVIVVAVTGRIIVTIGGATVP
jgi:hypothetical protein